MKLKFAWRQLLLIAALLLSGLLGLLSARPALATGESYNWSGNSTTSITATGGGYSKAITFNISSETATSAVYTPASSITCPGNNAAAALQLTIDKTNGQLTATQEASGTLAYDPSTKSCLGNPDTAIKVAPAGQQATTTTAPSDNDSCQADTLTWIICPVYKFLLTSIKSVEDSVIKPFLQTSPLVTSQSSTPIYAIWNATRLLANAFFVIAFIFIIFASVTSFGIDSYSLKKILPRVLMAAILVQFSYLIVSLGIDITNILGGGIGNLVTSPLAGQHVAGFTNTTGALGYAALISGAMVAAGSIITGAFLLTLVSTFFAIMAVFLTLVARQVLITLLVITAPLAFAAWILPNTEHMFTIWRKSLTRLLLMYPMIILLFASGKIFGAAAMATTGGGFADASIRSLLSLVAGVVPLFLIPATFRFAGAALNNVQSVLGSLHGSAKKGVQGSDLHDRARARIAQRKVELAAGQGVKIPVLGKRASHALTANPLARQLGRKPWDAGRAADIRAMADFSKDRAAWTKRLEEEGMTYEGYSYLNLGESWYRKERTDLQGKIATARAAGDMSTVAIHQDSLMRLDEGRDEGRRYFQNTAARAAALSWRGKADVMTDDDIQAVRDYTKTIPGAMGERLGRQIWNQAREGARKSNVHLVFTDINGNFDAKGLQGYVSKKNQSDWSGYTKDALEKMEKTGVLANLAQDIEVWRTMRSVLSDHGGPSAGGAQQAIIRQALKNVGPLPTFTTKDRDLYNAL